MKKLLIQQASGEHYLKMLDVTEKSHLDYCAMHSYERWILKWHIACGRSPHWNKIALIDRAIKSDFDLVVWMDADAVIVRPDLDIESALGVPGWFMKWDIGMVIHDGPPKHFNSGVIVIRAKAPGVREFFENVWRNWTLQNLNPWHGQVKWNDQSEIMKENDRTNMIGEIDIKWNSSYGIRESKDPVVVAFHNQPVHERAKLMADAMASIKP